MWVEVFTSSRRVWSVDRAWQTGLRERGTLEIMNESHDCLGGSGGERIELTRVAAKICLAAVAAVISRIQRRCRLISRTFFSVSANDLCVMRICQCQQLYKTPGDGVDIA